MDKSLYARLKREAQLPRGRAESVFLTGFRSESCFLTTVLHYSGIRVHRADSLEEADFLLTVTESTSFLCDVVFPGGGWRDALLLTGRLHRRIPVLIVAERADEPFLTDANQRGAFGLVWKPFDFARTVDLIRAADQAARERALWIAERKSPRGRSPVPFGTTRGSDR